jgi:LacI family transcriptional regulator
VICGNDFTAAQRLQTLTRMEVKVPKDLRVVGFDDVRYATLVTVPLTTMHQPVRDLALVALRTMFERIADPTLPARSILLAPHLVVRESCGAYLPRKG